MAYSVTDETDWRPITGITTGKLRIQLLTLQFVFEVDRLNHALSAKNNFVICILLFA